MRREELILHGGFDCKVVSKVDWDAFLSNVGQLGSLGHVAEE
jgi:hypothetical protein